MSARRTTTTAATTVTTPDNDAVDPAVIAANVAPDDTSFDPTDADYVAPSDDAATTVTTDDAATDDGPVTPDNAVARYVAASGPARASAVRHARAMALDAMTRGDIPTAVAWNDAANAMTPPAPVVAPIDYGTVVFDRAVALFGAFAMVVSTAVTPTGVPNGTEPSDPTVTAETTVWAAVRDMWDVITRTDPAVMTDRMSAIVSAADSVASARVIRDTARNDIQSIIDRAFAGRPAGTFMTVADVRNAGAPGTRTDGAIAARVNWDAMTTTLTGVRPIAATADRARGFMSL